MRNSQNSSQESAIILMKFLYINTGRNTSVAIKKYINQNCAHLFVQLCKSKTHLAVKRQLNAEKNSLVSFSSVKERAGVGQDKADGCDFFVGISLFK